MTNARTVYVLFCLLTTRCDIGLAARRPYHGICIDSCALTSVPLYSRYTTTVNYHTRYDMSFWCQGTKLTVWRKVTPMLSTTTTALEQKKTSVTETTIDIFKGIIMVTGTNDAVYMYGWAHRCLPSLIVKCYVSHQKRLTCMSIKRSFLPFPTISIEDYTVYRYSSWPFSNYRLQFYYRSYWW